MTPRTKTLITLSLVLALTVFANIGLWLDARFEKVKWLNIPPAPDISTALIASLGDPQLAYRMNGLTIQNMGDTGGRVINLRDYDYNALGQWFMLQHRLDPVSGFTPFLAGYFFGAIKGHPEKLYPVIDYLEVAAGDGAGQKWRFLSHAAFLARFKLKDTDRALDLAYKLAALKNPDMPSWTRQYPVFILNARGEKEAAYQTMVNLLKSSAQSLHPNEVNATLAYLCEQILSEQEAKADPLCKDYK